MSLVSSILRVIDLLDKPFVSEREIEDLVYSCNKASIEFEKLSGPRGSTLFTKIIFDFGSGRSIGIIGRLGGVGARPSLIGLVSDADGAIVALAVANKIAKMCVDKEPLVGRYIITTHISTHSPIKPEKPAPMMDSPIDLYELLKREVDRSAEAILSIDATKANRIIKIRGFAITPVVKRGWILRPTDEILDIYTWVTGRQPVLVPITMQDIVPYTTPVKHINSIVQPWIYTDAPVIGVAITSEMIIPGSATGVTDIYSLDQASRFVLEISKRFVAREIEFYYEDEYKRLVDIHGDLRDFMRRGAP